MNTPATQDGIEASDARPKFARPASGATGLSSPSSRSRRSPCVTNSRGLGEFGRVADESPEATQKGTPKPGRVYQLKRDLCYQPKPSPVAVQAIASASCETQAKGEAEALPSVARHGPASGLSKGHIQSCDNSGQVEIWMGAHALHISRPGEGSGPGVVNKRGAVRHFSRKSRQRMMMTLHKIKMNVETGLPVFTTNTFPDAIPDPKEVLRMWDVFWKKLERRFPDAAMIWRKELQSRKSGALSAGLWLPHYHSLIWNVPSRMDYEEENGEWITLKRKPDGGWIETIYAKDDSGAKIVAQVTEMEPGCQDRFVEWYSRAWYEAVGSGDFRHYKAGTRVEKMKEPNGVRFYVSKYIAKVDEEAVLMSEYCIGRWWGIKGRRSIPWGERVVFTCTRSQAAQLMRCARRYVKAVTGKKYRFSCAAMNVFIKNSLQWILFFEYICGISTVDSHVS